MDLRSHVVLRPWRSCGALRARGRAAAAGAARLAALTGTLAALCVSPAAFAQLPQSPSGQLGFYFDLDASQAEWPMPPASPLASGAQFQLYLLASFRGGSPSGQKLWAWEAAVHFDPAIVVLRSNVTGVDFASATNDFCVGLGVDPVDPAGGAPLLLASFDCMVLGAGVVNAVATILPQGGCVSGEVDGPRWQAHPSGNLIPFASYSSALLNPDLASWGAVKRRYGQR
jgi:hypothetical protein